MQQAPREVNATELDDPELEEELSYTIFVTGEEQAMMGNGTFYIGVKEQGKHSFSKHKYTGQIYIVRDMCKLRNYD